MEQCDECGFEFEVAHSGLAGPAIVQEVAEVAQILTDRMADRRNRPEPETWSPLEYGCHLRDVLIVQRERVLLARRVDSPSPPWAGEERVEHDGYAEQNPEDVARQLIDAAMLFATPPCWPGSVPTTGCAP